jgi:hypothetical protein
MSGINPTSPSVIPQATEFVFDSDKIQSNAIKYGLALSLPTFMLKLISKFTGGELLTDRYAKRIFDQIAETISGTLQAKFGQAEGILEGQSEQFFQTAGQTAVDIAKQFLAGHLKQTGWEDVDSFIDKTIENMVGKGFLAPVATGLISRVWGILKTDLTKQLNIQGGDPHYISKAVESGRDALTSLINQYTVVDDPQITSEQAYTKNALVASLKKAAISTLQSPALSHMLAQLVNSHLQDSQLGMVEKLVHTILPNTTRLHTHIKIAKAEYEEFLAFRQTNGQPVSPKQIKAKVHFDALVALSNIEGPPDAQTLREAQTHLDALNSLRAAKLIPISQPLHDTQMSINTLLAQQPQQVLILSIWDAIKTQLQTESTEKLANDDPNTSNLITSLGNISQEFLHDYLGNNHYILGAKAEYDAFLADRDAKALPVSVQQIDARTHFNALASLSSEKAPNAQTFATAKTHLNALIALRNAEHIPDMQILRDAEAVEEPTFFGGISKAFLRNYLGKNRWNLANNYVNTLLSTLPLTFQPIGKEIWTVVKQDIQAYAQSTAGPDNIVTQTIQLGQQFLRGYLGKFGWDVIDQYVNAQLKADESPQAKLTTSLAQQLWGQLKANLQQVLKIDHADPRNDSFLADTIATGGKLLNTILEKEHVNKVAGEVAAKLAGTTVGSGAQIATTFLLGSVLSRLTGYAVGHSVGANIGTVISDKIKRPISSGAEKASQSTLTSLVQQLFINGNATTQSNLSSLAGTVIKIAGMTQTGLIDTAKIYLAGQGFTTLDKVIDQQAQEMIKDRTADQSPPADAVILLALWSHLKSQLILELFGSEDEFTRQQATHKDSHLSVLMDTALSKTLGIPEQHAAKITVSLSKLAIHLGKLGLTLTNAAGLTAEDIAKVNQEIAEIRKNMSITGQFITDYFTTTLISDPEEQAQMEALRVYLNGSKLAVHLGKLGLTLTNAAGLTAENVAKVNQEIAEIRKNISIAGQFIIDYFTTTPISDPEEQAQMEALGVYFNRLQNLIIDDQTNPADIIHIALAAFQSPNAPAFGNLTERINAGVMQPELKNQLLSIVKQLSPEQLQAFDTTNSYITNDDNQATVHINNRTTVLQVTTAQIDEIKAHLDGQLAHPTSMTMAGHQVADSFAKEFHALDLQLKTDNYTYTDVGAHFFRNYWNNDGLTSEEWQTITLLFNASQRNEQLFTAITQFLNSDVAYSTVTAPVWDTFQANTSAPVMSLGEHLIQVTQTDPAISYRVEDHGALGVMVAIDATWQIESYKAQDDAEKQPVTRDPSNNVSASTYFYLRPQAAGGIDIIYNEEIEAEDDSHQTTHAIRTTVAAMMNNKLIFDSTKATASVVPTAEL